MNKVSKKLSFSLLIGMPQEVGPRKSLKINVNKDVI